MDMGPNERTVWTIFIVLGASLALAMVPIQGGSAPMVENEGGCYDCHEDFVPYVTEASRSKFDPDKDTKVTLKVTNSGNHEILVLVTWIELPSTQNVQRAEEFTESGTVGRSAPVSYSFNVDERCQHFRAKLTEEHSAIGLSDASLTLQLPNGNTISHSTGDVEDIALSAEELEDIGPGEFVAVIQQVSGLRSISYTLEVEIDYTMNQGLFVIEDIGTGVEVDFSWNLSVSKEDHEDLELWVSAVVSYEHQDGEVEQHTYKRKVDFGTSASGGGARVQKLTVKKIRNGLGYVMVTLFVISVFTGWPRTRKMIPYLKAKHAMKLHCYLSWAMVMIMAIHAFIATRTHPMTHPAVLTGFAMSFFFVLFALAPYIKGWRQDLRKKVGIEKWKIAVVMVILVLFGILGYHIVS